MLRKEDPGRRAGIESLRSDPTGFDTKEANGRELGICQLHVKKSASVHGARCVIKQRIDVVS